MNKKEKLYALPIQIIEQDTAVIVKRGCLEFRLAGQYAAEIIKKIIEIAHNGATTEEIINSFAGPDRPAIAHLVTQLQIRNILVFKEKIKTPPPEGALDIFYWHFNKSTAQVSKKISERHITIAGINFISLHLSKAFQSANIENVKIIDAPLLRNLQFFDENNQINQPFAYEILDYETWQAQSENPQTECIIASSDFGGQTLLSEWNQYCIEKNLHFMPIMLKNMIGYVGPIVIPRETACLECLRLRQDSHFENPQLHRLTEDYVVEGQSIIGFHPSMCAILGHVAAMELTKFYANIPTWRVGKLITINLLATDMTIHTVLKVPRCPVCTNLNRKAPRTLMSRVQISR